MTRSAAAVGRYLVAAGIVPPEAVVDGDLVLHPVPGRHRCVRVESPGHRGCFVKAAASGEAECIAAEARTLAALARDSGRVPATRLLAHDPGRELLVTELEEGAEDLWSLHRRVAPPPTGIAAATGRALAALHGTDPARWPEAQASPIPLALSLPRPEPEAFRLATPALLGAARIVQQTPALRDGLHGLRAGWRSAAPVHGDVSWGNVLATPTPPAADRVVVLVDWELAGIGDPDWDVGSALAAYLSLWLFSMPAPGADGVASLPSRAAVPLAGVHAASRALWDAYVDALRLAPGDALGRIPRTTRFAAARLVQTAIEASPEDRLPGVAALHLQVAGNVLAQPRRAAAQLLGLAVLDEARR